MEGSLEIIGGSGDFLKYLEEQVFNRLADGEFEKYELLSVRDGGKRVPMTANSVCILSQFQIIDPFKNKTVTCNWIKGEQLGDINSNGVSIKVPGKFKFTKVNQGAVNISNKRAEYQELRKFLSIHPQNKSNKGQQFHIAPKSYLFTKFDQYKEAEKDMDKRLSIASAVNIINELETPALMALGEDILGKKVVENLKPVILKAELVRKAFESPEKFIGGTNEKKIAFGDFGRLIDEAVKQKVLIKKGQRFWLPHQTEEDPLFAGAPSKGKADMQFTEYLKVNPDVLSDLRAKVSLS
jgi:hypothetical protein